MSTPAKPATTAKPSNTAPAASAKPSTMSAKPSTTAAKPAVTAKPSATTAKPSTITTTAKPSTTGKPTPGVKPNASQVVPKKSNIKNANVQQKPTAEAKPAKPVPSEQIKPDASKNVIPPSGDGKEPGKDGHEELAKSKSMSRFGNLLINDDVVDNWEPGLISQEIIDDLCCNQFLYDSDASDESYISITESGTEVKKYRKKKRLRASLLPAEEHRGEDYWEDEFEEQGPPKRLSVPDIDGGISKAKLKLMSIRKLKSVHKKIDAELEFIQTENFIMDRTVKKMEKRELEIEAAMPVFTYQFPWEKDEDGKKKKVIKENCNPNLSSDEDEADGEYVAFVPADAIDFNDPYFDDMSDHMKEAAAQHLIELGEVAPENFDVMRHTYGKLVKPFASDLIVDEPEEAGVAEDGTPAEGKKAEVNAQEAFMANQGVELDRTEVEDEDPEFPGFIAKQARKLPIAEKLKYAVNEEESLRQEFFDNETKGIQQENAIQVYIDTYINSVELIRKLQDTFKEILANGYHELTGHMKAESVMRFRKLMRYRLHNEETKITMAYNELKKQKRKVDDQVRSNRELGESIQLIDFEQLKIENTQFQGNLDDENETLKNLKIITGSCFQQLKEYRNKLTNKMMEFRNNHDDITVRNTLKRTFNRTAEKYTELLEQLKVHNEFLKKRLKVFRAPNTMEYMRQKAQKTGIQDEISSLKQKIAHMQIGLRESRINMNRLQKKVPARDLGKLNKDWLEEIKKEVKDKELMSRCLDDEHNPMGGSMQNFMEKYKACSKSKRKEEVRIALERRDSEGPSKINLGPEALAKELANRESAKLEKRMSLAVDQIFGRKSLVGGEKKVDG